ncbi:MAG: sugar phosphate isomerase/epimerase [Spirochaetia bacterium]|jgi:D-psicose/D-tagatose/L-ribulose 3-epimerase|nr:sugar phosphate isomerase/epimerase [Spirochaetia bacterium]
MRKVGIYYAYWCHEWDVDFFPFIAKVKKLGYDQLEINGGTVVLLSAGQRERLTKEAIDQGIILSFGIGLTAEHDVSSLDEDVRRNGIAFMKDMIHVVAAMGGKTICGTVYSTWPKKLPKGDSRERYLEKSLASMRELVKVAEDEGVTLLCESLNRFEQFLINTCEQAVDYVDQVDSPFCKILLDTFHMNIEEDSIPDAIRLAGSRLGGFHLGENNRKPVGYGNMDWKAIKGALDAISYAGSLVQEPFLLPGGQVGQDIAVWRDIVKHADLDEMAKVSAAYMKKYLA